MSRVLRVIHVGLGPIGQGIARMVLETEGLKLVGAAEEAGDQATADLATRRVEIHEKNAWMLSSHLE